MWRGEGAQPASLALYKTSIQHPLLSPKVVLFNSRSKSIIFGPNSQRVWSAPSMRPNIGQNQLWIETSPRLTPVANWPGADYHYFHINFATGRTLFLFSFHFPYEVPRAQEQLGSRQGGRREQQPTLNQQALRISIVVPGDAMTKSGCLLVNCVRHNVPSGVINLGRIHHIMFRWRHPASCPTEPASGTSNAADVCSHSGN